MDKMEIVPPLTNPDELNIAQNGVFHVRHCGLDPQSPQIGVAVGIPGQARDNIPTCFKIRQSFLFFSTLCVLCVFMKKKSASLHPLSKYKPRPPAFSENAFQSSCGNFRRLSKNTKGTGSALWVWMVMGVMWSVTIKIRNGSPQFSKYVIIGKNISRSIYSKDLIFPSKSPVWEHSSGASIWT